MRFRDRLTWGETNCGYGRTAEVGCTEPATRHFMWLDDNSTAAACDEHAEFIRTTSSVEFDEHPHGGDCGMPGALWHFPYEDEPEGYCVFPAVDDASLLTEEPEPIVLATEVRS